MSDVAVKLPKPQPPAAGRRFPYPAEHRDGQDMDTAIVADHFIRAATRNLIQALYVLPNHTNRMSTEGAITSALHLILSAHVAKPRIAEIVRFQMKQFLEIEERQKYRNSSAFANGEG